VFDVPKLEEMITECSRSHRVICKGLTHSVRSNLYFVVVVLNLVEPMTIRDHMVVLDALKRGIRVYLAGEEEVAQAEHF
jgi:uncharacterized protein YacL (UPF0231 family)